MTNTEIKRRQSKRSLSTTLATAFLFLSVVVLLFFGGLQFFFNIQAQQQTVATKQQLIAQDAAKAVSSFIEEKFSVLSATVRLAASTTLSSEEQIYILDNLLESQPAFRQLVLLDAQDKEIARASRGSESAAGQLTARLEPDALAQIRQDQHYVSPVYFDEGTGEPFVVLAIPAINTSGDVQGILLAEVNLRFMWDLVDQLKVGNTGLAYVVDKQGDLIAFKDTDRVLRGENERALKPVDTFTSGSSAASTMLFNLSTGIQGTLVVSSYASLKTPDWAVVIEMPWQEAYRDVIWMAMISVGGILGMALLAGLVGIVMAHRLTVPLVDLTETATRIAGGDLKLQAVVGGPVEIGSLAAAFNSMSASLQRMLAEETANRATLESTVNEYLTFVKQVTQGDLTSFLLLDGKQSEDPNDLFYTLGLNLNIMASNLAEMTASNAELLVEAQDARDEAEKARDEAEKARVEAEEANRVKSQFLASMSHELRTPLNAILNFSEMMALGMVGPVTQQQVEVMNKSLDSGRHLLALINDVLDITKIQSGTLTLFVEQGLNLQSELESVTNAAEVLLKNKPVQLIKEIDDDLPIISGDKRRIRQVLLNLLSNAAKFTEEGSITLSVKRQDGEILFFVRDTGPGILKDQQNIIFEPFVQTATGIRHAGGTGLGLPISKSFVEAHGGKLWVESEPDKGATFYFTLPVHVATATTPLAQTEKERS
jgi:signal transduction histidine kinase